MEFSRIRSPSSAPPDRRFDGSTETTAISRSSKSSEEPTHQLVDEARLARAAGAGDPHHRGRGGRGPGLDLLEDVLVFLGEVLRGRDESGHHSGVAGFEVVEIEVLAQLPGGEVGSGQHVADHPLHAHLTPIVGRVDPGDPVRGQLLALVGEDRPAAPTEDADVPGVPFHEQVAQIAVELHVTTLIGGHRDGVGVLLDGRLDDVETGPVVTEMDDFGARGLKDAAKDVDGGVVAIEQGGGGHEADLVGQIWPVEGGLRHSSLPLTSSNCTQDLGVLSPVPPHANE